MFNTIKKEKDRKEHEKLDTKETFIHICKAD